MLMGFHIIISNAVAVATVPIAIYSYIKFFKKTQEEEGKEERLGKLTEQHQQQQQQVLLKDESVSLIELEHHDQPQQVKDVNISSRSSYNLYNKLPSELVDLIVRSKLDVVTLCRCASALPHHFHPILPTLTSLSMTVSSSLLLPPDKDALKHDLVRNIKMLPNDLPKLLHLLIIKPCLPLPRLLFMKRFSRLESLSVELPLPILATDDYLTNSKVWFRWDSQFNISQQAYDYYYVSVHATILRPHEECHPEDVKIEGGRIRLVNFRHLKFHANTILSLFPSFYNNNNNPHPKLRTIVSKDMGMNGRLNLYSDPEAEENANTYSSDDIGQRCMFYYLPKELDLTTTTSNNNLKIKNVWLYFMYSGDVGEDTRNKQDDDRILMDCLNRGEYPREDLKEAVTKILSHPDTMQLLQRY